MPHRTALFDLLLLQLDRLVVHKHTFALVWLGLAEGADLGRKKPHLLLVTSLNDDSMRHRHRHMDALGDLGNARHAVAHTQRKLLLLLVEGGPETSSDQFDDAKMALVDASDCVGHQTAAGAPHRALVLEQGLFYFDHSLIVVNIDLHEISNVKSELSLRALDVDLLCEVDLGLALTQLIDRGPESSNLVQLALRQFYGGASGEKNGRAPDIRQPGGCRRECTEHLPGSKHGVRNPIFAKVKNGPHTPHAHTRIRLRNALSGTYIYHTYLHENVIYLKKYLNYMRNIRFKIRKEMLNYVCEIFIWEISHTLVSVKP